MTIKLGKPIGRSLREAVDSNLSTRLWDTLKKSYSHTLLMGAWHTVVAMSTDDLSYSLKRRLYAQNRTR